MTMSDDNLRGTERTRYYRITKETLNKLANELYAVVRHHSGEWTVTERQDVLDGIRLVIQVLWERYDRRPDDDPFK